MQRYSTVLLDGAEKFVGLEWADDNKLARPFSTTLRNRQDKMNWPLI
jgi:hypothetical protein